MNTPDVYWLAGLLEGEGSFVWHKAQRDPFGRPRIQLQMTDRDVMEKFVVLCEQSF